MLCMVGTAHRFEPKVGRTHPANLKLLNPPWAGSQPTGMQMDAEKSGIFISVPHPSAIVFLALHEQLQFPTHRQYIASVFDRDALTSDARFDPHASTYR